VRATANRRLAFIATVAGVSILSQFLLELVAAKVPVPGLAQFTAFTHRGAS
jgi:hypothetical protein